MMESEEPPQLDHGIPEPEVFLPETPDWYWLLVGLGGVLSLLLLWWLFRILKPSPRETPADPQDFFTPAMASLDELESSGAGRFVAEVAADLSLVVRLYLAGSHSDPALYETAEEFAERQTTLPERTRLFLQELNDTKYAKSERNEDRVRLLVKQARREIKHLRALPRPTALSLPVRGQGPTTRQIFAKALHAAVPLALLVALTAFLRGLYDGADTGSRFTVMPLTWISIAVAALSLFAHLFLRSEP